MPTSVVIIGLGLFLLGGLLLVIFGLTRSRQSESLEDRLEEFGALERAPTLEEMELAQPFSERVLLPLLENLAKFATRFTPQKTLEATQHRLDVAGNPNNLGAAQFLGLRILLALLVGGLGYVLLMTAKNLSPILRIILFGMPVIGYFLPVMWLSGKISRRQEAIVKALPDTLDLLTICVEAGLGFDAAMARVADKWDNELCLGFSRVMQELQLGKLRRDALRHMAETMEVRDVTTFVAAIIQAGQLGVSIAKVLRIQSEQMRMRRRQRAEELANQAPLKMMPALLLIFPALFIVLLGPAVVMVKDMFMGGGGGLP